MLDRVQSLGADYIDLDNREVPLWVLSDRDVYRLEMEKIFGRAWLLLAHETEIPAPGDFVVRDMGDDKVIVARDRAGEVHVSLNVCPHRGMRVCMTEAGNATTFKCIYHGWAFKNNGDFIGAPIEKEKMHGELKSKSELGLPQARVASYGKFIFATWDLDGPDFETWLGDYKFYTDAMFLRTIDGLEMLGPPQRFIIDANWKLASEQFAGDAFHTLTLHKSLFELGRYGAEDDTADVGTPGMDGINVSSNGHSMRLIPPYTVLRSLIGKEPKDASIDERLELLPPPGMTREMLDQLKINLDEGQRWLLAHYPPSVGGMFPNVGFLWYYTQELDGSISGRMTIHTMLPRGIDKFELTTWVFAEKCTPDHLKHRMLVASTQAMGSTGMTEQDDSEAWPHISIAARGWKGGTGTLKYQAFIGERRPEGWPGGGKVFAGMGKDDNEWEWWKRWNEMMRD